MISLDDQPALLRYQNIIALRAGLRVSYDEKMGQWEWVGTEAQLKATGLFAQSQKWDFLRCRVANNVLGMRASLSRCEDGLRVKQWTFYEGRLSYAGRAMVIAIADADTGYQAFKATLREHVEVDIGGKE